MYKCFHLSHRILWLESYILLVFGLVSCLTSQISSAAALSLHTNGNKMLLSSGQTYIPEGISVYGGLESHRFNRNNANIYAQIQAAATYWHANTIRLQVAESNLFSHLKHGQTYNQSFLSALNHQVTYAHSFGMAVVINDQTEFTNNTPNPTRETARFWRIIANLYKDKPYVIFDIFNEPRLTSAYTTNRLANNLPLNKTIDDVLLAHQPRLRQMSSNTVWSIWRDGGDLFGTHYVGMQSLIDQIRLSGAQNLIWVEGSYEARLLPPSKYLLQGSNIAYSIHHPNLNRINSWKRIGTLASKKPVVEGEWAQYQSTWAECFTGAYKNAPRYIHYLHQHQIGIIAWSLQANSLVRGSSLFKQPSNLNKRGDPTTAVALKAPSRLYPNYACNTDRGEGVGNLLQTYFAKNSTNYHF